VSAGRAGPDGVRRIAGLRRTFRAPWRRPAADVEEEFAFHMDMRAAELEARGEPPAAARQEAIRQFGDVDDARAYCRHLDERRERRHMRTAVLDAIAQDVRLAARALRRAPAFTLVAVLTLALGVGANVTMLGVVDRLLLRAPAHVREPARVRRL
jgi:putative ABC transport system permease protein